MFDRFNQRKKPNLTYVKYFNVITYRYISDNKSYDKLHITFIKYYNNIPRYYLLWYMVLFQKGKLIAAGYKNVSFTFINSTLVSSPYIIYRYTNK